MVKALECRIFVSEFERQSCYYIHFWINTPGKGINPTYPLSYGVNNFTTVLREGWIWH